MPDDQNPRRVRGPGIRRPRPQPPSPAEAGRDDRAENADRLRRRALFLRELDEARELRERVTPRRAREARMRQWMRMRSFRR